MSTCVLLTATVAVHPGMPSVGLRNLEERLRDYQTAVAWWLAETPYDVVFVENSGHPISLPPSPRLEVIQFVHDSPALLARGKGYGEFLILQKAYRESRLLRAASTHVKCTGRFIVAPVRQLQALVEQDAMVVAGPSFKQRGQAWCDSVCWVSRPEFFDILAPLAEQINEPEGRYMEGALEEAVTRAVSLGHRVIRAALPYRGRSGTSTCIGYGEVVQPACASPWWGALDVNGWKYLSWFGYFKDCSGGWIYHAEHGWLYYGTATTTSGLWIWSDRLGWVWISDNLYPWIWSYPLSSWLWYYRDSGDGTGGWFFDCSAYSVRWL